MGHGYTVSDPLANVEIDDLTRGALIGMALEKEDYNQEGYVWMSFATRELPEPRHLGAMIVKARGPATATKRAWAIGQNPGGEVMMGFLGHDRSEVNLPDEHFDFVFEKLRTKEEMEQAGMVMGTW